MSKIYGIGDEEELAEDLQKELFELKRNPNIIEIPDNATNGDMIKALFPNYSTDLLGINDVSLIDKETATIIMIVHKWWWNAPYKKGEHDV